MILVDPRDGPKPNTTSVELRAIIQRLGVPAMLERIDAGDVYFEGHGPKGVMGIAVERKTLPDMLNCIDSANLSGNQKIKMQELCGLTFLILEGVWGPDQQNNTGYLMSGWKGGWFPFRPWGRPVMYSKLYRYIISLQLSGVIVIYSRDIYHTAYNICEIYHYFQKAWTSHTSMLEIHKIALPDLRTKPPLVRKWANDLEDIGVKHSLAAEAVFKTPFKLANADESAWLRIKGIGIGTAQRIIKEIRGW